MAKSDSPEFTDETVGGRQLRVARWRWDKPSKHPPLLFFNGIGANIEAIAPLAQALSDRAFITFDMPGVGGSPDPVVPYVPFLMSCHANDLLERFDAPLVDVMGVSWGGAMAQHFAFQHSGRVRKLVLAATTAGMLMVPGKLGALSKMINPRRYVDASYMEKHFRTLYGGLIDGKAEHISRLKPPTPRGYLYQILCMIGWTSVPVLPFMKAETLIMMGEEDAIVPLINGKILNTLIPGSRLETFAEGGHLFILTHSDRTVALLREFLAENEAIAA